jgi:peptide/nickel transport system substrate-binding protein
MASEAGPRFGRREFLGRSAAGVGAAAGATLFTASPAGAATRIVRMRWPWPVGRPDPHASNDLVAALLGQVLFPPLYARAIDGMLEPKLAIGAPKEAKNGLRVDLAPFLRPSDVVASISNARVGAARLALREVPVPRVDGAHGVVFPGLADADALMRRLSTPLAGIARYEPRRTLPTGAWDLAHAVREGKGDGASFTLSITRRPTAPSVGLSQTAHANRPQRFEIEGPVEIGRSLRAFERYETDVAWLTDGLFAPRPGSRPMDLGPLAYLALRAGAEVPELRRPGAILSLIDALAPDRMAHLGLLRRGHAASPEPGTPAVDPAAVAPNVPILVRASMPIAVAAADILAQELGGIARALDDATFDREVLDGRFPLALDVVRAVDDTADGAALALATFERASSVLPGVGARAVAQASAAAIGWEIAAIGAQAAHVWIPRASIGGFDLEAAGVG